MLPFLHLELNTQHDLMLSSSLPFIIFQVVYTQRWKKLGCLLSPIYFNTTLAMCIDDDVMMTLMTMMAMMTTIIMMLMMIMMLTLSFQQHSGNVHPSWLRMTESARGHKKTFAIHICMSWKSLHFSTKSCPIYHLHWLRSSVMNGHGCGLWPRFKNVQKWFWIAGDPGSPWVTDPLAHVERVNTNSFF